MGKTTLKRIGIAAVAIVILAIIVWQLSKTMTSAEPLTEAEATSKVQDLYEGEIVEVSSEANAYLITINLDTGTYVVEIDRDTGDVQSLIRTKQETAGKDGAKPKEQAPTGNEGQGSAERPPDEPETPLPQDPIQGKPAGEPNKEPAKQITKETAAEIALKHISGEVDDIEIEQSGGITYYLVEIEREDEEDGTVQINAISGEVMTITWDD